MKIKESLYHDSIYNTFNCVIITTITPEQEAKAMMPKYIGKAELMEIVKDQLYISNDNGKFKRFYIYNNNSISPIINKSFESIQAAHEHIQKYFRNVKWTTKDCKNL
jgi:hypothetical protein